MVAFLNCRFLFFILFFLSFIHTFFLFLFLLFFLHHTYTHSYLYPPFFFSTSFSFSTWFQNLSLSFFPQLSLFLLFLFLFLLDFRTFFSSLCDKKWRKNKREILLAPLLIEGHRPAKNRHSLCQAMPFAPPLLVFLPNAAQMGQMAYVFFLFFFFVFIVMIWLIKIVFLRLYFDYAWV